MKSGQWSVVSGQWTFSRRVHAVRSGRLDIRGSGFGTRGLGKRPATAVAGVPFSRRVHAARSGRDRQISNPQSLIPNPSRSAFTLVEMLVTVTIIGILAAMTFGVLQLARETAREAATKATVAKLHSIIMRRYESYMTRRVPIRIPPGTPPAVGARMRLDAIRDLMRMEMPERWHDIDDDPVVSGLSRPALSMLYQQRVNASVPYTGTINYGPAKCLYMIVSMMSPEAMEQFSQSEIGVDERDNYSYFVDGWGRPIMWLRWAPGFCSGNGLSPNPFDPPCPSDVQSGNAATDHDPFDTRNVDVCVDPVTAPRAFHLIPLVYSAGSNGKYGLNLVGDYHYSGDPYANMSIGAPTASEGSISDYQDNITNHHIEQR